MKKMINSRFRNFEVGFMALLGLALLGCVFTAPSRDANAFRTAYIEKVRSSGDTLYTTAIGFALTLPGHEPICYEGLTLLEEVRLRWCDPFNPPPKNWVYNAIPLQSEYRLIGDVELGINYIPITLHVIKVSEDVITYTVTPH